MTPAATGGVSGPSAGVGALPTHVGPYRILRLLGEGGMGRVYLARESHPQREVALKLVRGISPGLVARLRREIDTLAQLEHPGIARLYAAGEASVDGMPVPWLAMEYVDGEDLLAFVRAHGCGVAERLRLLVRIARAMQYAHERGVIHRDLKPGNILVDANGDPKILDFGVARRSGVGEESLTLAGQVLGTVPYMSPEQLGGGDRRADARSDVYSLGVIAYELVSGQLPHPHLATATLFEALDTLRRRSPPPLASIAATARGDLDTVVMKALASEPARRYASAAAFADDLEHVLDHRPIVARPPTTAYRVARFVQRHRALSVATAIVFLSLVAATVVSLRFAWSAQRARAEAEQRAQETLAINGFLEGMLASADPGQARGRTLTVAELVDQAERDLDRLDAQPAVQAGVAATLASTRGALGEYEDALALNRRALDAAVTPRPQWLRQRVTLLTELRRFDEARAALAEARAAAGAAPIDVVLDLDLAEARIHDDIGEVEQAVAGYRALIARAVAAEPPTPAAADAVAGTLDVARSNLSAQLRESGDLVESEALVRAVLDGRRQRFGERAPATLASRHKLSMLLDARGDHAAAVVEGAAALALQREVLGDSHPSTLTSMQTLANSLVANGEPERAEPLARESMQGFERQFGDAHVQALAAMNTLAYILDERGDGAGAEALYRRIIAIQQRAGSRHPSAFAPRNNLAMLLMNDDRLAEAEAEFASLVADATAEVGPAHLMTAIFLSNRGLCLTRMGRLAEARDALEAAHAQLLASVGASHARTRTAAERLADVHERLGARDKAAELRASAGGP